MTTLPFLLLALSPFVIFFPSIGNALDKLSTVAVSKLKHLLFHLKIIFADNKKLARMNPYNFTDLLPFSIREISYTVYGKPPKTPILMIYGGLLCPPPLKEGWDILFLGQIPVGVGVSVAVKLLVRSVT